ncbi:MAG: hypothetical protein RLO50_22625 [Azospirillaceae bacterium]
MSARLGPILFATIACRDLDRSLAAYRSLLGWPICCDGTISGTLADLWRCPALAGARWALLAPGETVTGGIRFIEVGAAPPPAPLTTTGWAAAELSCDDLDGLVAAAPKAGFRVLGAPAPLGSNPAIRAMQLAGPDGEVLYLTDIRAYAGTLDLYRAGRTADRVFIAVLAATDIEAARGFYEDRYAAPRISDREVAVPVLRTAHGLADSVLQRISSLQLAGSCLIECDGYPAAAPPRGMARGLPLGVAMITMAGLAGAAGLEVHDAPYGGAAAMLETGAAGEWLEIVEHALPAMVP